MIRKSLALLCGVGMFSLAQANDSFGGIGLVVVETSNGLVVETIVPNTPAAESSLNPGDVIFSVDGKNLDKLDFDECVKLFRDVKNKPIEITYISEGDTLQTTLRRTMLTISSVASADASVENFKGLKYISTVELGEDGYYAVYLDDPYIDTKKEKNKSSFMVDGIRLVQIRNNIISYEDKARGGKFSTDLNGKSCNNKVNR